MSRLNFERYQYFSRPSDGATDDLPRAGSRQDQHDFLRGRAGFEERRLTRGGQAGSACTRNRHFNRDKDLRILVAYLDLAEHRDFSRKTEAQKADILKHIRLLLAYPTLELQPSDLYLVSLHKRSLSLLDKHATTPSSPTRISISCAGQTTASIRDARGAAR